MPEDEVKQETEASKDMLYPQSQTGYVTVSTTEGQACAGCRWFKSYGSQYSEHPSCHLVQDWPLPIEPTGWCNQYEALPVETFAQTPMPVVIVDPATLDMGVAEVGKVAKEADPNIVQRLISTLKNSLGQKDGEVLGFKVYGDYWFARWSNNFEDRDGEWFSEKAHDDYISRLHMGNVEMPDLWVEHIPGTKIGKAKVVNRVGHFMVAAGEFDDTLLGNAAKSYYKKHAMKGVSHGFLYEASQYIDHVFNQYNSFEISPLRKKTPSNPWTTFDEVKAMKLTEKDLSILNEMFGEELVKTEIIDKTEQASKVLAESNIRFKDFGSPAGEVTTSAAVAEKAERDFKQLIMDIVGDHAEVVQIAAAMSKAWEAQDQKANARIATQDGLIADLQKQLKETREEVKAIRDGAPRASTSAATEIDESKLSQEVRDMVKQQTTVKHPFWGTEVTQTP